MKKIVYILIPIVMAVAVLVTIGCVVITHARQPEATEPAPQQAEGGSVQILDAQGQQLLLASRREDFYQAEQWAYLEIVLNELTEILMEQEGCDAVQAQQLLFSQNCQVQTSFDPVAYGAMKQVAEIWMTVGDSAYVLTDTRGNLVAAYSHDAQQKKINHTLDRRSPYSSFKALSVYTPALEQGVVNWSTAFVDSPYKQIKAADGSLQDWPANATGEYTQRDMMVYEALKVSQNTVAVKCLAELGVSEAIKFLQTGFDIPLVEEEYVVANYGADEAIGSVALGYLETGITPVEMAGYYQIFANGGSYTPPECVQAILLEDGSALYTRESSSRQVVRPATADTMNRLLQGVVEAGGTGKAASCEGVEVAGKTGTGDDFADNWFVGVTPDYSLSVWHGQSDRNYAAGIFSEMVEAIYNQLPNANRRFLSHVNLEQLIYCEVSGKAISPDCALIGVGYYESKETLPVCDVCKKQ